MHAAHTAALHYKAYVCSVSKEDVRKQKEKERKTGRGKEGQGGERRKRIRWRDRDGGRENLMKRTGKKRK